MPPRPLSTFDRPLSPIVHSPLTALTEEPSDDRTILTPAEEAWVVHQEYLEYNGFILRPRLRRDWKPSWLGTPMDPSKCEDSIRITEPGIVDATRTSDGAPVVLKAMRNAQWPAEASPDKPDELGILKYLHSPPYTGHICNHAVPLLGSISMPNSHEGSFAVLPLLRVYDDPPFLNVAEAVEFMKQVLRGLAFMHAQSIVHRDIKPSNIMMAGEVLYDEPFHPVAQSLSLDAKSVLRPRARHELDTHRRHDGESAVRYYFINFSRASHMPASTEAGRPRTPRLLRSTRGQLGRFPEAMLTVGHDPFKADVYCLGKYVIDNLIARHLALAPFTSVARYMTRRDPRTRPTAAEAFAHFETIRGSLEGKCLRIPLDSRLLHRGKAPSLPLKSPRRAMSTLHLSSHIPHHHSHGSWSSSSTDSGHTLVASVPTTPVESTKTQSIAQVVMKGDEPESRKPLDKKKSKGAWSTLRTAIKIAIR
ncbi:60S ribosomal protein L7 [Ceratobasidium sp. AG-Ba]|nr:60S ribosomal protein L7 [Ceratobasidium sp. AG-Ba]